MVSFELTCPHENVYKRSMARLLSMVTVASLLLVSNCKIVCAISEFSRPPTQSHCCSDASRDKTRSCHKSGGQSGTPNKSECSCSALSNLPALTYSADLVQDFYSHAVRLDWVSSLLQPDTLQSSTDGSFIHADHGPPLIVSEVYLSHTNPRAPPSFTSL